MVHGIASHADVSITSVFGNKTLAELESTPKDSDLVGGTTSPCIYVTAAKAQREFGLFGVTSATVHESLPSRSRPIHNRSLQRHGLQDQLAYCTVKKKNRPARF